MESSLVVALLACVVPIKGTVGHNFRFTQFLPNQPAKTCLVSGALSNNINTMQTAQMNLQMHAPNRIIMYAFVFLIYLGFIQCATVLMTTRPHKGIWDSALV